MSGVISSVGGVADRYVGGLPNVDAIVADPSTIPQAMLAAVRRRERAEPFYAMLLFEDNRLGMTYRVAAQVARGATSDDERVMFFSLLSSGDLTVNGGPFRLMWPLDEHLEKQAYEFYTLADAILVRSFTESAWVASLFTRRPPPPIVRVLPERVLPVVERTAPPGLGVVIWAPQRDASFVSLHASALADLQGEVTCVVAGGTLPPGLRAAVLRPGDAGVGDVLARATAIVCVESNDPADAVAFAARGYGVVAPLASGAHEYVRDVQLWNGHFPYHLYTATTTALGRPASLRERPAPPPPLEMPAVAPAAAPKVSIVMPTFNRRDLLARVLSAVAAQTYPNIEAVVVNDAGENVDDVVAAFPFARLIVHAVNAGVHRAQETGYEAMTGEYVMFLPDDDWIYPDHVARVMAALLRGGGAVAHSNAMIRYLGRSAAGEDTLRGINATVFSQTMGFSETLVASPVSVNQCIQHRRVFEEIGWIVNESEVGDNEFHMRMIQRFTPVYVPNTTCEFRDHQRGSLGKSADLGAALKRVYEQMHPFPERPYLAEMRRRALEHVAQRVPGESPFNPSFFIS